MPLPNQTQPRAAVFVAPELANPTAVRKKKQDKMQKRPKDIKRPEGSVSLGQVLMKSLQRGAHVCATLDRLEDPEERPPANSLANISVGAFTGFGMIR